MCLFEEPYCNTTIDGKKKSVFDAVTFCQKRGGGGRDYCGGFSPQQPTTKENYLTKVEELFMAMKDSLV